MILEIVSPESKLFQGEVTSVSLPGVAGSFQVLNHHAPIVSTLKEGVIKIGATSFKFDKEVAGSLIFNTKFACVFVKLFKYFA